jgi:hypothetical protein
MKSNLSFVLIALALSISTANASQKAAAFGKFLKATANAETVSAKLEEAHIIVTALEEYISRDSLTVADRLDVANARAERASALLVPNFYVKNLKAAIKSQDIASVQNAVSALKADIETTQQAALK